MKIQIGNEPYLYRPTGLPLEGRLTVYKLNTDVKAKTYTLEGTNFVQAANPVLLHSGLPDDSLFVDVGLYTIRIERYIGPEGQMSVESPDEYFEIVDQYEAGLDFDPQASSANVVDTLEDLQECAVEMKYVTVLWHTSEGDCVPRQYIWDAQSQDTIDGGYVVGSNKSDTGRWILLWGDEILPASVYGVTPANEGNLNGVLSYPATVGSFFLKTAPCVRFQPGDYNNALEWVTDKELVFDGDTRFLGATFTCPRARMMGTFSSYVADFVFTARDAEAHSSWFRTVQGFWQCGAKFLYLDTTNYFANSAIAGVISLADKVIFGNGRLPCTYNTGAHFVVAANTSISGRIFSSADFVRFIADGWGDGVFARTGTWDPGLISQGHHVQFDSIPDLDLFASTERWVATMVERRARISEQVWTDFTLDLQNRRYINSQLNVGTFRDIRNVYCNRLYIGNNGADITLHNVHANEVSAICRYLTVYDSDISFPSEAAISAMWGYDSRINSSMIWRTPSIQCIFERCWIGIVFNRVTNNEHLESLLSFTDCQFQRNVGIQTKNLEMYRCRTDNGAIKIYPYKDGDTYRMRVTLIGNAINSSSPVEFTKIDMIDGRYQEDCYDIVLNWNITGNMFSGNNEGLRMRYWQNRTGSYYTRTFIKGGNGIHSIVYEGNVGQCPDGDMRGVMIADNKAYTEETISGDSKVYKYQGSWKRCLVVPGSLWWNGTILKGPNTLVKWYSWVNSPYNSLTYDMFVHTAWFAYPRAHDDPINNGDFFANALLLFGDYLRIVQRGDGDRNDGVVGKVI